MATVALPSSSSMLVFEKSLIFSATSVSSSCLTVFLATWAAAARASLMMVLPTLDRAKEQRTELWFWPAGCVWALVFRENCRGVFSPFSFSRFYTVFVVVVLSFLSTVTQLLSFFHRFRTPRCSPTKTVKKLPGRFRGTLRATPMRWSWRLWVWPTMNWVQSALWKASHHTRYAANANTVKFFPSLAALSV